MARSRESCPGWAGRECHSVTAADCRGGAALRVSFGAARQGNASQWLCVSVARPATVEWGLSRLATLHCVLRVCAMASKIQWGAATWL